MWRDLIGGEQGQDMVEYSLLLAFLALAGAATYVGIGGNVNLLWGIINGRLVNASN